MLKDKVEFFDFLLTLLIMMQEEQGGSLVNIIGLEDSKVCKFVYGKLNIQDGAQVLNSLSFLICIMGMIS